MSNNSRLTDCKLNPRDEYYTLYADVEREMLSYPASTFRGKVVLCNCDGPSSNFYRFFSKNFHALGLRRLICTSYSRWGCIIDENGQRTLKLASGDFRSQECLAYARQCDIICTNPPFSLAKEYIPMMLDLRKKLIIVCPQTVTRYAQTFPYFRNGTMHTGNTRLTDFVTPEGELCRFGNIYWFTNLPTRPKAPLKLTATYSPAKYPFYDEVHAIEVGTLKDIPKDYRGVMGVPESILLRDWWTQFEIAGSINPHINGKAVYQRILVRRR